MSLPRLRVEARAQEAWPEICERFALQMIAHAEHLRPAMDRLESDEADDERLQWLYQIDHSVTRMRRAARDMRILAGVDEGEMGGDVSTLVDVVRAAESAIEHYSKVVIGRVVDMAVVAYASDDVSSLLAALLDNATNYSPSTVTVSARLIESGAVLLRVEDSGIGIPPAQLEVLNSALAGPVPAVNDRTGRHTGFPVVHRLARRHNIGVRFASRTQPSTGAPSGTIAMVMIPPDLLCEVPDLGPVVGGRATAGEAPGRRRSVAQHAKAGPAASSHLSVARSAEPEDAGPPEWRPEERGSTQGGLPRRTRTSLRGADDGRPRSHRRTNDTSEAARSFAEDLSAFTAGDQAGRGRSSAGAENGHPEGEAW